MQRSKYILPLIVLSQFATSSVWFVGNAILPDLQAALGLKSTAIGTITSVVQLGFISGTLVFALLAVADRFSPSRVFFVSSLLAAASNLSMGWLANDSGSLLFFRFLTGFFLAGIYPVGMKIAADWYEKGLGKALGWLVGALVVGTAFPHLLKDSSFAFSAQKVILYTSLFAVAGGVLVMWFVKDGPYRKRGQTFHPGQIKKIFHSVDFRSAAFGYFGHMWELYTFWAFVPVLLTLGPKGSMINIPLWTFFIIGIGGLSCIVGGYMSQKWGSAKLAFGALLGSGICCLVSYFVPVMATSMLLGFMVIWGITVIADSPQFSALVAQKAPPESRGTALTLVTSIGFAITIVSIELINYFLHVAKLPGAYAFMILGVGPLVGLVFLSRLIRR